MHCVIFDISHVVFALSFDFSKCTKIHSFVVTTVEMAMFTTTNL